MVHKVLTVTLNPSMDRTLQIAGLSIGDVNRVNSIDEEPAGKGINVAKVLQLFGLEPWMAGFLGGYIGDEMLRRLQAKCGNLNFTACVETTRMNIKVECDGEVTEFNGLGPQITAGEMEAFLIAFHRSMADTTHLVLSGSLPPGIPKDTYANLIAVARQVNPNVFVCLDASGEALMHGMKSMPDMIKPNLAELGEYLGKPLENASDAVKPMLRLFESGVAHALCSLGADGMLVVDKGEVLRCYGPPIQPVQTVGCGDSAVAAYLVGLLQEKPVIDCAVMAVAAGSAAAARLGIGLQSLENVDDMIKGVQWERMRLHS